MALRVELRKGMVRFFYRVVSKNGNILSTSQKYWSKGNAKRAAKKHAAQIKGRFIDYER